MEFTFILKYTLLLWSVLLSLISFRFHIVRCGIKEWGLKLTIFCRYCLKASSREYGQLKQVLTQYLLYMVWFWGSKCFCFFVFFNMSCLFWKRREYSSLLKVQQTRWSFKLNSPKRWGWSSTVCPEGGSRSRDMRSPSLWQQRAIIIDDSPSRDHKILIKNYQVIKTQAFYYHLSAIFMWCTGTPHKGVSSEDFVCPQRFLFASGQQMFFALSRKKILGRAGQYHDRQGPLSLWT